MEDNVNNPLANAGFDSYQIPKALEHETRASQQHQGQGYLGGDQNAK